jgi:predicted PurR-regulated permease PerM
MVPHDPAVHVRVRAGLVLLGVLILLAGAWIARDALLLGFLGVVFAVALSFPVDVLARWMRRGLAVGLVFLAVGALLGGLIAVTGPTLATQLEQARQEAPEALAKVRTWLGQVDASTGAGDGSGPAVTSSVTETAIPAITAVGEALTGVLLVIVLSATLVAHPDVYHRGVRRLFPRTTDDVFEEAWRRLGAGLRGWVKGILVSMTLMGGFTAAGLGLAGVNQWMLLGFLTFLGTFVPYLGAVASAVPGLLVALAQDFPHFVSAFAVYLAVHVLEGYVVQPIVMKRAVEVQPAMLLTGQVAATAVFGLLGTIVATPLLVCLQVMVDYLWIERELGREPGPSRG